MRRARLGRYALYQLWDWAVERGVVTLLLVAMTMGPQLYLLRTIPSEQLGGDNEAVARRALRDLAMPIGTLVVLFAVNGVASLDRQRGYFRFLFSKPLRVEAYYAQDFFVRLAGICSLVAGVTLAFALITGTRFNAGFLAYVAFVYALLGGIGFLLSSLVQFDGLILVLVWLASAILLQIHRAFPERIPTFVVRALPPVDKFEPARDAWIAGTGALPASHFWWVVGYGAGCFVLGLFVLRRRPLAT